MKDTLRYNFKLQHLHYLYSIIEEFYIYFSPAISSILALLLFFNVTAASERNVRKFGLDKECWCKCK